MINGQLAPGVRFRYTAISTAIVIALPYIYMSGCATLFSPTCPAVGACVRSTPPQGPQSRYSTAHVAHASGLARLLTQQQLFVSAAMSGYPDHQLPLAVIVLSPLHTRPVPQS